MNNTTFKRAIRVGVYGFTLMELLIVVSIIGILATIILASLNEGREKARVTAAVASIKQVEKTVSLYIADTGTFPAVDCMVDIVLCDATNDPFLVSDGNPEWRGPYGSIWDRTHPWGGHIGVEIGGEGSNPDGDGNGVPDYYIFLDDDRVGTSGADNGGRIPDVSMLAIDRVLDDGNLTTGRMRGGTSGPFSAQATAIGEMAYKVE
jgi:prepilin-type N-terminal cleavage/methylation domain-containing protein